MKSEHEAECDEHSCISRVESEMPLLPQKQHGMSLFIGPGLLIAVGYMDPGNWATDIESGSKYAYSLLFVILLSNCMAMLLQHLTVRLAIHAEMDLAEATAKMCGKQKYLRWFLWFVCEIAIIAMDLSEVIGSAIAIQLLFGLALWQGVLITGLDVLLILAGISSKRWRIFEVLVGCLVAGVFACFAAEMAIVGVDWMATLKGFIPTMVIIEERRALFLCLGIIGATVMPHNLYLHSNLVKKKWLFFKNGQKDERIAKKCVTFASWDSSISLFFALFVNAAIMITAAAAFHKEGHEDVTSIKEAAVLLKNIVGNAAHFLFAIGLLMSGQSSTMTGTMAGQIVIEGFLNVCTAAWKRRLATRLAAIIPALIIVIAWGDSAVDSMLLYSQVILCFQLPFAVIPLVWAVGRKSFVGENGKMGLILAVASWLVALIIVALNIAFLAIN